ncbi:PREDICTED: uncharacterized protein LOC108446941 [Corvus brachyrhynchos]|uniref:uncharacterized protein LOC108446941 n=1 Tax=Corvus brachyrhynchos TaxID=85066 RepID=UPI0008166D39|nr:PREDICTED: uncharacterized protein LOC108446941 [Corvus brachyrhynchos]
MAGYWGWGETPSVSQACSQCGAAGLARLHTRIYLFTSEIPQAGPRRAPAQQKYSRNASDRSRAAAGPQASGGGTGRPCVPLSTGTQLPAGRCPQGARPLCHGVAGFPVSHQGGMWDSHCVGGTFIIFPCLRSSWFGSFSALTEGLVLLWCPSVGESQGVLGGGLCPVGSAMGQHVSAKFPGKGMREIMLARQKCCCHQTAGLGIPVEVAPMLSSLGTPMSPQALSAVLCQPCQGCLMWPVPCAVGCARLEPPASHGNGLLLRTHLSPLDRAGTCSAASWGPSVPCLCHCCSSMPPVCLAPCHQLLPAAPSQGGPRPPAPCLLPHSHCFQGDLGLPEAALP